MEIPRGLALLLLMIHLTREEVKREVEKEEEEEEEEESAAPAQLPPGLCYALSKEILSLFFFNKQCILNTTGCNKQGVTLAV